MDCFCSSLKEFSFSCSNLEKYRFSFKLYFFYQDKKQLQGSNCLTQCSFHCSASCLVMAVLYLPDLQLHVLQLLDMQQPLLFSLLPCNGCVTCVYIYLIFNSMSSSCLTCSSLSCSASCLAMAVLYLPDLQLHILQLLDMQQPLLFSLLPGSGCVIFT